MRSGEGGIRRGREEFAHDQKEVTMGPIVGFDERPKGDDEGIEVAVWPGFGERAGRVAEGERIVFRERQRCRRGFA